MHQVEVRDYVSGLDGLRGLAVLYTSLCHIRWIPLASRNVFSAQGVTIFYVLSGYLVTGLLYDVQAQRSKVSLVHFYTDRALRLFPELFVMIIVTSLAAYTASSDPLITPNSLLHNGGISLLFLSDFEDLWSPGARNIWINTWSVAVEAQFYLYWSLVAPTIFYLKDKRRALLGLALLSIPSLWVKSYIIRHGYSQPSYVFGYAAPFSHLWKMMLGASLTLSPRKEEGAAARGLSRWTTYIGMFTFAATLLAGSLSPLYTRRHLYYWEISSGLASALLIHGCVDGNSSLFANPAIRFLGRISYALYLYQDPLVQIVESTAATCIAFAAAVCSSFWIGEPIRTANKARRSGSRQGVSPEGMV